MAEIIPFKTAEEAFKHIRKALGDRFEVKDSQEIQYGLQFFVILSDQSQLVRIYSSKKGTKLDLSQVKNTSVAEEIRSALGINLSEPKEQQNRSNRIYTLCIGINDFQDASIAQLNYAAEDARSLNTLFVEQFGYGEGTIKLINSEANLRSITASLLKLKELAKTGDTVIIFIATHGEFYRANGDSDFYLITADSEITNLVGTALAMKKLKSLVSQIPSEKKVIFMDTCYSGGICRSSSDRVPDDEKSRIFQNFSSENFVIITSCCETEKSQETDELKHGVFTYYLLSGLTGAVEEKGGIIDIYTLYVYLNQYVNSHVKNKLKKVQTPSFYGTLKQPIGIPKLSDSTMSQPTSDKLDAYIKKPLDNDSVKIKFETINCIGIDESGKGDYFGSLVVAAVYVNSNEKIESLKALGVKDCKKLSDVRVLALSKRIKKICDSEIIGITPPKYNELYSRMANLNEILAWAHAQSLEKVLIRNKECSLAISDQFAWKEILLNKLKTMGKKINLLQRPKAEENIAVATASILARARFLEMLSEMGRRFDHTFNKGANEVVISQAVDFLAKQGKLEDVAKVHFKTTKKIQELYKKATSS